jgi:hypothetical protein
VIRKLTQKDNKKLMRYVLKEPEINLFIIGDIENYGYESDFQTIWGEFDSNNNFKAVFVKFYSFFIVYSAENNFAQEEVAAIICEYNYEAVSGKLELMEDLKPYFKNAEINSDYFAKLDSPKYLKLKKPQNTEIIKITEDNLLKGEKNQFNLFKHVDEFNDSESSRKAFKNEIKSNTKRVYQLKYKNNIVATVSSAAENSKSAMIVGVATHPGYRNRGFATYLLSKLSKDLLDEGKTLCLFYDNPDAGSIYRRLGFENIGRWGMLSK